MKIVQINTYYGYGSTGHIVCDLETAMYENGMTPYVFYGRDIKNKGHGDSVYKINSNLGFMVHKLTTHILGYQGLSSKLYTKNAIARLEEIQPDLIHLHNLHGHYLNIELLFSYIKSTKIPVIWTFHDCWPFTGHCGYFFETQCEKWKSGCGSCLQKTAYPRSLLFDRSKMQWQLKKSLYSKLNHLYIVTVSKWLEALVRQSFLQDCNIQTIYNGIDCNTFYPRKTYESFREKYKLQNKKIILGVASGWTQRKGIHDFIQLAKKIPDNTVILLVGEMPASVKLPSNIISYGAVTEKERLAEFYSSADVFVNPSRQETFGLTTAEAMACGTPAVVYNVSACPEIVGRNPLCGAAVVPYNIEDLQNKTMSLLNSSSTICVEAAKRIKQLFNRDGQMNEYIQLYQTCSKTKSNTGYC